jgi:hypothetical protein
MALGFMSGSLKNFTAESAEHAEVSRAGSFGVHFDPL